jgi:anhydro-N-acetylmuramic acid kinase
MALKQAGSCVEFVYTIHSETQKIFRLLKRTDYTVLYLRTLRTSMASPFYHIIGLMSGTSLDGVDAALLLTDGEKITRPLGFLSLPYEAHFRAQLRSCFGIMAGVEDPRVADAERQLTQHHAIAVQTLLKRLRLAPAAIDYLGFHGQTLWHRPQEKRTCQIGDGALLAQLTGIATINDFRSADVAAGGQGAPLVPLYHAARATTMPRPLAVLNIGGVANISWLDRNGEVIAFDTGPGCALLDDWMLRHTGMAFDAEGAMAATGRPDLKIIEQALSDPYFLRPPPKSLDRNAFSTGLHLENLSVADGAATLALLTARCVERGLKLLGKTPLLMLVTGGGRHHPLLMRWLQESAHCPVQPVEAVGWNGDALEAEAFAYLAARHIRGLPLSLPSTTGVPMPMTGGKLWQAPAA